MKNFCPGLTLTLTLALAATLFLIAVPAMAQQHVRRSPHETVSAVIDGSRVMVVYGRPYTKDPKTGGPRKIWGELIPYGKIWRTGADEATLLVTEKTLVIGGVTVPAGAYTLWTLPRADGTATLIINKQIGQWGDGPRDKPNTYYNEKRDVGRVALNATTLDKPVDQFTITIDKAPAGGGLLTLAFDNKQFSVPFTVSK